MSTPRELGSTDGGAKPEQLFAALLRRGGIYCWLEAPMNCDDCGAPALQGVAANDRDRSLIAAITAGDEAAFNEIHARYYQRIASFTRRITRRSELTAEITNDTLWAIWRCAPSFKGSSKVSTWILGIAYRVGQRTLQRTSRHEAHEQLIGDFISATPEAGSEGDDREWIGAALVQLSVDQRTVLELFYHLGHSCEEIARRINCPTNTVKTRMHHGRRKLRRLLPPLAGFETGLPPAKRFRP